MLQNFSRRPLQFRLRVLREEEIFSWGHEGQRTKKIVLNHGWRAVSYNDFLAMYVCFATIIKLLGGCYVEFEQYVNLFKHEEKHDQNGVKKEEKVKHNFYRVKCCFTFFSLLAFTCLRQLSCKHLWSLVNWQYNHKWCGAGIYRVLCLCNTRMYRDGNHFLYP